MAKSLFIGVDGGATKCALRIEDEAGNLLGEAVSGPANIRLSVPMAWQSIHSAFENVLRTLGINQNDKNYEFHAGMGLAGCEIGAAYKAFVHYPHKFHSLSVTTDAHTACLGAHGGKDGALIIAGTGVAGYQIEGDKTHKVSGWGFPQDDIGSGAWLGLEAVRVALQWHDGRISSSGLAKAVFAHFDHHFERFINWTSQANSTGFAELAPLVIQVSKAGDTSAVNLMRGAARAIDAVSSALLARQENKAQPLPLAMVGGIAPFLEPYLGEALRARLTSRQMTPEAGAILMIRNAVTMGENL